LPQYFDAEESDLFILSGAGRSLSTEERLDVLSGIAGAEGYVEPETVPKATEERFPRLTLEIRGAKFSGPSANEE
jgi:hypothetical protein